LNWALSGGSGTYPFATLKITINNICCDEMLSDYKQGKLTYDFEERNFRLNGKIKWSCPYCGRLFYTDLAYGRHLRPYY
jgi:hypothetical protein